MKVEHPGDLDLKASSASMQYGGGDGYFTFYVYERQLEIAVGDVGYYGDSANVTLDMKSLTHLQKLVEYAIAVYPQDDTSDSKAR